MSWSRTIVVELRVRAWDDGSLSIEGPVDDTQWMLALLDHVRDAVSNRAAARQPQPIMIPGKDVSLHEPR